MNSFCGMRDERGSDFKKVRENLFCDLLWNSCEILLSDKVMIDIYIDICKTKR